MNHLPITLTLVGMSLIPIGCSRPPASQPEPTAAAKEWAPAPIASPNLPNAYRLHAQVISGGQPHGEEGFRELNELGVKTVISVDGAPPQLVAAKKYGLRYVHLPHGYDGVPEERGRALAKAVRDLPGPFYIHCHHGKHRSPAAATVACIGAGLLAPENALTVLKTAGTNPGYRGLYESAQQVRKFEDAVLDELILDFPESVQLPPLAEAMVAIEHTHDRLKTLADAGWKPPPGDADQDAAHEALLLQEHFTELLRTEETLRQPARFQYLLRESERAAAELESALRAWTDRDQPVPEIIPQSFDRITKHCKACHVEFRDVPLSEKLRSSP